MKKSITVLIIVFIVLFIFILNIKKDNNYYEEDTLTFENDKLEKISEDEQVIEICNKIKSMDITIKQSPMNLSDETHILYKQAYLDILKNKIPSVHDNKTYFKDLGTLATDKFENLLDDGYGFYYCDLDGDGLPELGIRNKYTCIIKYYPDLNKFRQIYRGESMYYTILGTGQIWYHDGLHAGLIRNGYITINDEGEWVMSVNFEEYFPETNLDELYYVSINENEKIAVGEENYRELIKPFLKLKKNAIPAMSMEEIFGELLQ